MADQSTADRVLNALASFNLKKEGPNHYRSNRPWCTGSDSMGLILRIHDGEHGTYYDHVLGEGGSLYQLAGRLDIPPNRRLATGTTKRLYTGLADYASAHGVDERVFLEAGWCEFTYSGRPALKFPTENGNRYRLLDSVGSVFRSSKGYHPCWYGLELAVDICWEIEHPLVLCNGESSVVVAQHFGLPACAVTGGEKSQIPPGLLSQLEQSWQGKIIITPDCDKTGRRMAAGVSHQLKTAGYQVQVLDLNGEVGFDLGDFCALHQGDSFPELLALKTLEVKAEPGADDSFSWMESEYTDIQNAVRLAGLFRNDLRWVHEWGWLTWTGKKWERDRSGRAHYFSMQAALSIYREAANAADTGADGLAKQLAKWAQRSSFRVRLEAALKLAEPELSAHPQQFDTDPYLLNLQNGVLDLRTGELQPHDPQLNITRIAGAAFDPDAGCPEWLKFIGQVFDRDQALIEFTQRALGYSLTGSVDEQALFFLYGTGANGKSTFLRVVMEMLGDYAKQSAPQLIMMGDRHPAEQADLFGARFVATIEVEEGRRMAEVLVKQLTGGDRIKARYMHKDWFEFEPTHKIWLAANHKPIIRGTDHAIWRRFRLVPFTVTFAEDEQDHQLLDRLNGELSGILNWALGGCREWQELGLQTPEIVKRSTNDYRGEMDLLAGFIEDCCVTGIKYETRAASLYQAFTRWCEENGERPWTQSTFGLRLKERGFPKRRMNYGNVWENIGLVDPPSAEMYAERV